MGKSRTSGLIKTGAGGLLASGVSVSAKTMTISELSKLSDEEMADAIYKINKVELPDELVTKLPDDMKGRPIDDFAQKFFYANGLNAKPTVLNDAEFSQYMKDNHLGKAQILTRDVSDDATSGLSASEINNMTRYGKYTYLGGILGGNAEGNGIYFARTGGDNRWGNYNDLYDKNTSKTMLAVFDKSKFNPISISNNDGYGLPSEWAKFEKTHPKTVRALKDVSPYFDRTNPYSFVYIGSEATIEASLMGYNVITKLIPVML